jgi:hypothetical protein
VQAAGAFAYLNPRYPDSFGPRYRAAPGVHTPVGVTAVWLSDVDCDLTATSVDSECQVSARESEGKRGGVYEAYRIRCEIARKYSNL